MVDVDYNGYLDNFNDWNRSVAEKITEMEGLCNLSEIDWKMINYTHKYYCKYYSDIGLMRKLALNFGKNNINPKLFPPGRYKLGYKIAGLPSPTYD